MKWRLESAADVEKFWSRARHVPARIDGRTKTQEEQYCLALYLFALSHHRLLRLPLLVSKQESPDFVLRFGSGRTIGLEITRATENWLQQAMTDAERRYSALRKHAQANHGSALATTSLRHPQGWAAGEAEGEWCKLMLRVIDAKLVKLAKFTAASRHDLLIADDTPLPTIDRRLAFKRLNTALKNGANRTRGFGIISAVISLDVGYDLGGKPRLLSYIDWNSPHLDSEKESREFSRDAEFVGKAAVDRALGPTYSIDESGRILKETFDGRVFEIELKSTGEEKILRQVSPE